MTISISFIMLDSSFVYLTAVIDSKLDSSPSSIPKNSRKSTRQEAINRGKTSRALRMSRMEEENEGTSDQITAVSSIDLNEDTIIKYQWRGTRKSLILRYFVVIWRKLCEQEHLKFDEKEELSIRNELADLLNDEEAEIILHYIKQRVSELM